jgi:hypothetical protein
VRTFGRPIECLSRAALGLAAYAIAISPAAALDCSAIILDRGGLLAFGRAQLGDPRSQLPADASAPRECDQPCLYTDDAGVTYLERGGEIVRKEIPDVSRYRGVLPVRISPADSLLTILSRLAAFSEGAPIWSLNPLPGGGLLLRTDNCIEANNGVRGSYGFTFDREGRLSAISAEIL